MRRSKKSRDIEPFVYTIPVIGVPQGPSKLISQFIKEASASLCATTPQIASHQPPGYLELKTLIGES